MYIGSSNFDRLIGGRYWGSKGDKWYRVCDWEKFNLVWEEIRGINIRAY